MRFLLGKYRIIVIWMSLLILALAFLIGSDTGCCEAVMPLAFAAGTLIYVLGAVREWMQNRMFACMIEALLVIVMLTGLVLSLLRLGGMV
ncbi:MAG: hypothetical protein KH452_07235 [Clostridiales bacterium]|nr:hypothetical protein [Clostridiales bacterium]